MRAIWKGHIRFSLVTIPIRVYSAIESSEAIRFNQLHAEDFGRIGYDKRCKKCNDVVKNEDIVKGFEHEPDQYVVIDQTDLDKLRLKSTKIIEIEGFVDRDEVNEALFDTPYFIGPDGTVASKTYGLLSQTLQNSGKYGVGRVVLRDRESVVLLAPHEEGIVLYKLRYPREMRDIRQVPDLVELETDDEQLKLSQMLVDSMSVSFGDLELVDRYKDAVRELIQAKVDGQEIVTVAEEERPVVDIMTALKQSIDQAKSQKKPMQKAEKKKATRKRAETATG